VGAALQPAQDALGVDGLAEEGLGDGAGRAVGVVLHAALAARPQLARHEGRDPVVHQAALPQAHHVKAWPLTPIVAVVVVVCYNKFGKLRK